MACVNLGDIKLNGGYENGVYYFKGIPYAQSPADELRFKPPQPISNTPREISCTEYRTMSLQENQESGEDCLYLNVFSTSLEGSNKSVLVWVHGGGYTIGSGNVPHTVGEKFAKEDIVFVSVNYRVGILGFLNIDELGEDYSASSNNGFLDLLQALRFINDNIHHFGGDKNKITLMGQSAGAKSVASLMFTPLSTGLFGRAILQSGSYQSIRSLEATRYIYNKVKTQLKDGESLLTAYPERILELQRNIATTENASLYMFGPTIDGVVFKDSPETMLKANTINPVPCIIGINRDECNLFLNNNPMYSSRDYDTLWNIMGKNADLVLEEYENLEEKTFEAYSELLSRVQYKIHSYRLAEYLRANCYFYSFNWEGIYKAAHAQELPFIWNECGEEDIWRIKKDTLMSKYLFEYWCAFVKEQPMVSHGLRWPMVKENSMINFDDEVTVSPFIFDFDICSLGDSIFVV